MNKTTLLSNTQAGIDAALRTANDPVLPDVRPVTEPCAYFDEEFKMHWMLDHGHALTSEEAVRVMVCIDKVLTSGILDTATVRTLKPSAVYERYKLQWMLTLGHTLTELMSELERIRLDDPDATIVDLFREWESDHGFGSAIYPCYEEFLGCEFREYLMGLQAKWTANNADAGENKAEPFSCAEKDCLFCDAAMGCCKLPVFRKTEPELSEDGVCLDRILCCAGGDEYGD